MADGPGPRCGIERANDVLDDAGREMLELLLADYDSHGWTDRDIAQAIGALVGERDDFEPFGFSVVRHHRQKKCRCAMAAA